MKKHRNSERDMQKWQYIILKKQLLTINCHNLYFFSFIFGRLSKMEGRELIEISSNPSQQSACCK